MIKRKTFYDWCLENNHQDFLELWDYELNDKTPQEIPSKTKDEYYFKCKIEFHKSRKMRIDSITGHHKLLECKACNSFAQWCINNDRIDLLDRWDYELNTIDPFEVPYARHIECYFKCQNDKHESELCLLSNLTTHNMKAECKKCNSFAQYLLNTYGDDALEKYWAKKNIIDPWSISKCNTTKTIWINCQNTDYHGAYSTKAYTAASDRGCPYCGHSRVHPMDSLGNYLEQNNLLHLYASDNIDKLYHMAKNTRTELLWHCNNKIHMDYKRSASSSVRFNVQCPECAASQGELKISRLLTECKIDYVPQYTFDDLIGLGGGLLMYDFYLPKYDLLIEYQGHQHENPVDFLGEKDAVLIQERFEKQQEHDCRKRQYAADHNIKLLEIWYYDFDNIEQILTEALGLDSTPLPKMLPKYRTNESNCA